MGNRPGRPGKPAYRDVTAPNADTLYSNAFVDVSKEPWVVSWPDMGERYYVWEFYSAKPGRLVARAGRPDLSGDAAVLAEGSRTQWGLEASGRAACQVRR